MTIKPNLKRICRRRTAALIARPIVGSACRMGLDGIGLAPRNIDAAAVGFPTRNARRIMLVGICDAFVVLLAVFVFFGIGIGIAAAPKILDEILAFLVCRQGIK